MRLKAVGAEILAALTLACPVLAFSEPIGSDDAVIDADDTIAADTPDSDSNDTAWLSASKDTSTQVTAEVDSFYTLTVPEEITLNGSDGTGIQTGTIPVTLMGDIPLKGTVQVKTTATPLQAKGSVDVPMTIATPKVEWNRTEMLGDGTSSDYSVSAVLAPGDWTGRRLFARYLLCVLNTAAMAYLVSGIKSRHNILCFGIAIYHILWYNISTGSNDSKEPKV